MSTVAYRAARGHRTIRLPLAEADYERFLNDGELARAQLDRLYSQHPELFPEGWRQGYVFYGFTPPSRKQQLRCRRVRLRAGTEVFTIAPGFVMPYMTAPVAEVEKALFLMRFHSCPVLGAGLCFWARCDVLVSAAAGFGPVQCGRHNR